MDEETRTCTKCGTTKPLSGFVRHTKTRTGYLQICKDCKNAYLRAYFAADPERRRKRKERKWRWRQEPENRAYENAKQYERNRQDPSKAALASRKHLYKKLYGITIEDYDRMAAEQGGCAICHGSSEVGRHKYFHIDHDHETGKVRGLLCSRCNTGIGLLGENPEIFRSAIRYLSG